MIDRLFHISIVALLLCTVSIVIGNWVVYRVTPAQVAPSPYTLTL